MYGSTLKTARAATAALAIAALAGCAHGAPGARAAKVPADGFVVSGEVGRRVDDFLSRMSGFGWSGNALLVVDGAVVLKKGYGWADPVRRIPYGPATAFDIGSMAKTFTAVAVIQLELAGRLRLEDRIGQWLPGVPQDKEAVTVEQLLTHTAGVAADFPYADPGSQYEDVGRDEALRRILSRPLSFAPGTRFDYSNCGYILLAAIVERASGRPFQDYVREAVLGAAGLEHTGFWGDERFRSAAVAVGTDEYGEVLHDPMTRSRTTWQDLGGGQMLSTLDDLARWAEGLAGGRILPPAVVERLFTARASGLPERDYGYGWFVRKTERGTTLVEHGGDYLGTGAQLSLYREDRVLLVTSTNVRHDMYPTRNRVDRVIPKLLFGGDHPEPPGFAPDDTLLRRLVGTYRLPTGGAVVLHERGGRFFVGARGQDATDLLLPVQKQEQGDRAALGERCRLAFEGIRDGDLGGLAAISGRGGSGFARAIAQELTGLGLGKLVAVEVLGTFPSGFPRGDPPDYETTLLDLELERGRSTYAVRWANVTIGATEFPRFALAADAVVQPQAGGDVVSWNVVFSSGVRITPQLEGERASALVLHAGGGEVRAVR
ncbi:MAG: serine hydrolase domain-containing protein [Thermoanaerobaculia bacterium]